MKKNQITIGETGEITIPAHVCMRSFEIADLFGVYTRTVDAHIKAIMKTGITLGDYSGECLVDGNRIVPLHFGMDMIIALAFRIDSLQAKRFRDWVLYKTRESGCAGRGTWIIRLPKTVSVN